MSERYTRLFSLTENLYTESSPLLISAGALLKDNQTGNVLVQLKFQSISQKTILAVKVSVSAFDVSGNELEGVKEFSYLDLNANRNVAFGQKNPIPMPDKNTRSFEIAVTEVVFTDHSQWHPAEKAQWTKLSAQNSLTNVLGQELAAQYRRELGSDLKNVPTTDRDLWLCACGGINHSGEASCCKCHKVRDKVFGLMDKDTLQPRLDEYNCQQEEKRQQEEQAQAEALAKQKVFMKKAGIVCGILAAVVAIVLVVTQVVMPAVSYNGAVALMEAGQYEDAVVKFEKLGDYKDSAAMIASCQQTMADIATEEAYNAAVALQSGGNYEVAIYAFTALNGYKDSDERIANCETAILDGKYNDAVAWIDAGQYEVAITAFTALNGYKDSTAQIAVCEEAVLQGKYDNAVALQSSGDYKEAIKAFSELDGYQDSAVRCVETYLLAGEYGNAVEASEGIASSSLTRYATVLYSIDGEDLDAANAALEALSADDDVSDLVKEHVFNYALNKTADNDYAYFSRALFVSLGDYKDSSDMANKFSLRLVEYGKDSITYQFLYDEQGRIATKYTHKNNFYETCNYSYDSFGRLEKCESETNSGGKYTYTHEYDSENRIITKYEYYGSNQNPSWSYHYKYNETGAISSYYILNASGKLSRSKTFSYEYDSQGRVANYDYHIEYSTQGSTDGTCNFSYDDNGLLSLMGYKGYDCVYAYYYNENGETQDALFYINEQILSED